MEKYQIAVDKFIRERGYLDNKHVLGISVYGSYVTGYNNKDSDIDVHIIMDCSDEKIHRAVTKTDNFKIEYFEKPLFEIYMSVENDFEINENAYLSIIGHGKIIYDRIGAVAKLQKYILEKYSYPIPALSGDDAKEMAVIIYTMMVRLKAMYENNSFEFTSYYYHIVEKIRKFYSRTCGCANIPLAKVIRIYTDEDYRDSIYKSKIPDEAFIDMYFKAIDDTLTKEEKMNMITELYNYAIRDLDIDPNNYRILIKSRNNPRNKNHE